MQIFSKLFEILSDAEQLLSLSAEELAGPLLVSLKDSERIKPNEVISYHFMKWEIEEGSSHRNPNLNYPSNTHKDVLHALMEAWQWLEREGFVTPLPTNTVGYSTTATYGTEYFISRRGQRVETPDDLESYRKANLLPKAQLHPIIAQKVWSLFLQGDYDTAVFQAFKQVEVAVREAGYYAEKDIGVPLMRTAFHKDTGNLTDPNQQEAEREAIAHLFAGAIGSCKNPSSHRNVEITAEEAVEIIILASHLLRIVDSRNQSDENWQKQFANGFVRHLKEGGSLLMDAEVFMGEDARGYPRYIGFNIGKIENLGSKR